MGVFILKTPVYQVLVIQTPRTSHKTLEGAMARVYGHLATNESLPSRPLIIIITDNSGIIDIGSLISGITYVGVLLFRQAY